jgi:hypothetical protein
VQTHRDIEFGDGTYRFRLTMAGILAIEEKCRARIGAVHAHVLQGWYAPDDATAFANPLHGDYGLQEIIEICRQGLIGGGSGFVDGREIEVGDHLATHLVRTYLEPDAGVPLSKAWELAVIILQTCDSGYEPPDETAAQKKSEGDPKRSRRTKKADSTADKSSETAS